ncbi:serine/threonine protein kinase [Spongiactinospora rosea]|uniref:non-specific serine/threonine protein kinase n=1 Tax=Spongiactinospora rosea TaxID=2248750 RepID=A0A366LVL1_9ACTN|nr:serine/threonine protein kinase [Spongiactinospora rosea]RBQ17593.1 serine/threonine protein kinase [Spongiactinospora rosea]
MFGMPSPWQVPGYTELRELGSGMSGRVVMARHNADGVLVAIKYLSDELRADIGFVARFRHEARLLETLDSPQVARLYQYVETADGAAIIMELVDGVALRALLRAQGPTGPEAALTVLKGALLGLAAAHAAGVVHRDFKPENVVVGDDGSSKLVDFGIAVRSGDGEHPAGTPPYMAPEQWAGAPAAPTTDVYAATVVFFECLTGTRPYRGSNAAALAHQHQTAPVPVDEVPPPLRDLVARGLAKQPSERPPTAADFLSRLETVAEGAYGADWESRGRRRLAALAGLLALQFPGAEPMPEADSSLAQTEVGGGDRAGDRGGEGTRGDGGGDGRADAGRRGRGDRSGRITDVASRDLPRRVGNAPLRRLGLKMTVVVGCIVGIGVVMAFLINGVGNREPELQAQGASLPPAASDTPVASPIEEETTTEPTEEVTEEPPAESPSPEPTPTADTRSAVPPPPQQSRAPQASPSPTRSKTPAAKPKPSPKPTAKPTRKPTVKPSAKPTGDDEPTLDPSASSNPRGPGLSPRPTPKPTTQAPTRTPPTRTPPTRTTAPPTRTDDGEGPSNGETSEPPKTEEPTEEPGPADESPASALAVLPGGLLALGLVTSGAVPVTLAVKRGVAGRHRRRR